MRLTIEENRAAMKRYGHIRPAPRGSVLCSAMCPGTIRICTLERGHSGPHVAHGSFKRIMAVWDKGTRAPKPVKAAGGTMGAIARPGGQPRGVVAALKALRKHFSLTPHAIEAGIFLLFALAMVGFAIDWALRILGLR